MCLCSLRQEYCSYPFRFHTVMTEKGHYQDSRAVRTKVMRRRRRSRAFTVAPEIQIHTNASGRQSRPAAKRDVATGWH